MPSPEPDAVRPGDSTPSRARRTVSGVFALLAVVIAGLGTPAAASPRCTGCPKVSFAVPARSLGALAWGPVLAADLNSDGIPDLAFPLPNQKIGVMLGRATSDFYPVVEYASGVPAPNAITSIVNGDFDGDGLVDLVVAAPPGATYLRGSGAGAFQPPLSLSLAAGGTRLTAADLDRDGVLDLVASTPSDLTLYHGDGFGHFSVVVTLPAGPGAGSPGVADLNGDGVPDVFVNNPGAGTVTVALGVLVGPVAPPRVFSVGAAPSGVVSGDFNGDGRPDLAVSNGDHGLTILLNSGTAGLFGQPLYPAYPMFPPPQPSALVVGRFDGDAFADLAVVDQDLYSGTIRIFSGDGAGNFSLVQSSTGFYASLEAADLNRDGFDDLVTTWGGSVATIESSRGGLRLPETYGIDIYTGPVISADFNGDGRDDVGLADQTGFEVFLSTPGGGFAPPIHNQRGSTFVVAADMNNDTKPDLLWYGYSTVWVYLGNGDGTFAPPTFQPVGIGASALVVGDLNGDGSPDAVVANWGSNTLSILLGAGNGTFASRTDVPAGETPNGVVLADLNEDGKLDVVVTNESASAIRILLGNGSGGFAAPTTLGLAAPPEAVATGDFDGDGHADLAIWVGGYSAPGLTILFGNGAGGFPRTSFFPQPETYVASLVPVDVNGDVRPDLVIPGVTFFVNDGAGGFSSRVDYLSGGASVAVGDFDGDGHPDVVSNWGGALFGVLRNTNCVPRHLALSSDVSACPVPGVPFVSQPAVAITDDGGNVVVCDGGLVSGSILPGSGPAGAVLLGTTAKTAAGGIASFTDLAIDRAGLGYRLDFGHAAAGEVHSRSFSSGVVASISGPAVACTNSAATYDAGPGFDSYEWTLDSVVVSHGRYATFFGIPGAHTLSLKVTRDACVASTSRSLQVSGPPIAGITVFPAVCPYAAATASVPDAGPGATYSWAAADGAITSGASTPAIGFRAGPSGAVHLSVTVTNAAGCSASAMADVTIDPGLACPPPVGFFSLPPCRIIDTRDPVGLWGGPPLGAVSNRTIGLTGRCGIPPTARSVLLNVVVVNPTAAGFLTLYPAETAVPNVSAVNYKAGRARANNTIISLGAKGDLMVECNQASGTTDLVLDVYGYFE